MAVSREDFLANVQEHVPMAHRPFRYQIVRENQFSPHEPIAAIVSSLDDVREFAAAVDLAAQVGGTFAFGTEPSVVILSAENSIETVATDIVSLLAAGGVGAIVTFGGWTAQALAPGYKSHNLRIPYLFSGLHSIAGLDLADEGPWRKRVTGVVSKHPQYREMLEMLRYMAPGATKALVLQHPDHVRDRYKEIGFSVTASNLAMCREAGLEPVVVLAKSTDELRDRLHRELTRPGGKYVILTGNDSVALSSLDAIVRIAGSYNTPVLTQCLDAVAAGAALGSGARGGYAAPLLAERLQEIMAGGTVPQSLPVDVLYEPEEVYFNSKTVHMQGLYPTREQLVFLRARSIYDSSNYPLPLEVRMQLERGHTCC